MTSLTSRSFVPSSPDSMAWRAAERIQLLGGTSLAMAPNVAETTLIPRAPRGREELPAQLHAHEIMLKEVRTVACALVEGNR